MLVLGCGSHGHGGTAGAGGRAGHGGISGSGPGVAGQGPGAAGSAGGGTADGSVPDHPVDAGSAGDGGSCASVDGGTVKKAGGRPCSCAAECSSNFCVDGFCCNEACAGGCRTCALSGSEGTCVARSGGADPRAPTDCAVSKASTCGLDGKCDGAGACRKYPAGTQCQSGMCSGDAVTGALVCDGQGNCRPGSTKICSPFSCDSTAKDCYSECSSNSDCVAGHVCDGTGSCGPRMNGWACTQNSDCQSQFCANNVCCNVACQGPCVSCALPSREGTCWPTAAGDVDPNGVCKDLGSSSCGTTGKCDGFGGCARYPVDTPCAAAVCYGTKLTTAASCDGLGTCRPPGLTNCSPFLCTGGACTVTCKIDSDCDKGIACVNGSCGPKLNGQSCGKASECKSGQCVDGVCCESACTGACRSCALPSSPGKCLPVGAGNADPRLLCKDAGTASCGQNGKCDGAGSCQLYDKSTSCAAETCASNVYTPGSTCDGAGRCVTPSSLPCSPFTCNGSKCFTACTTDAQCLTPNRCVNGSCGLANNGASCSAANQCKSGFCAQGYCCDKACTGACQSCALSGTLGACTNVATGNTDPAGVCKDQGASSCGTNGRCQAGACQKYGSGTSCAAATCPSGTPTFTATAICDGAGTCVKSAPRSCFPYLCGSAACKAACTSNADCASPAVCINGSCGLKDNGSVCADGTECKSGFCRQGVCCATECNSTCKSCNAAASTAGTCTNVAAGKSDPAGVCKDAGAASCGANGVCDGAGACQRYAAGTVCVASSCPTGTSTQTNARTCDGAGTCRAATTISCTPFACNGTTACNSACKVDSDCQAPNICDPKTNLCGNKVRQGKPCSATSDCLTGLTCVDNVCCGSSSCNTCQACNVSSSPGTCTNVPSGAAEPHGKCAVSSSSPCGNTGACNGTGGCQLADTTKSCAAATCSGSTFTPSAFCNGTGACATPASSSCSPYVCGTGACKSSCTADGDCVAPFTCQGSSNTKSCSLKANGLACSAGNACISGNCVDGVCCGSASCPACQACNVNGAGSCAPLGAGSTDTRCGATAGAACGKTNSCDGAGACANSTAMCAPATCSGSSFTPASFCSGASATCPVQAAVSCGTYTCTTAGCKTSCASDGDCASGSYCASGGHCVSAGGPGDACTADNQCGAGRCVDGVCCGITAASCPLCQACNLAGSKGTCAFVGTGVAEPHNLCAASGVCGNTGTCAADQTCAKAPSSTMCGAATCSAGTETMATFCDGAGKCAPPVVRACDPYVCGPTACAQSCAFDTDCIPGDYCAANGTCQTKLVPGAACSATTQCASGVCGAEGVCCDNECAGNCVSCKLATSPGTCHPLAKGIACGATSCSADNRYFSGYTCDGAGTCGFVDPSAPIDCVGTYGLMCSPTNMCM